MTDAAVVLPVSDATYHDVVLSGRGPVLLAFMAETDSSCRAMRPILAELARQRAGRLSVATVDVAANPALVHAWGITGVPILLLLHQGVLQRVLRGVRPYARLVQEIDEMPTDRQTRYPALLRRVHEVPSP
jgi:thioredoxin 1